MRKVRFRMLKSTLLSALLRIVVHQSAQLYVKSLLSWRTFFFNDNIVFLFEHIGHALGASAIKHLGLADARRLGLKTFVSYFSLASSSAHFLVIKVARSPSARFG